MAFVRRSVVSTSHIFRSLCAASGARILSHPTFAVSGQNLNPKLDGTFSLFHSITNSYFCTDGMQSKKFTSFDRASSGSTICTSPGHANPQIRWKQMRSEIMEIGSSHRCVAFTKPYSSSTGNLSSASSPQPDKISENSTKEKSNGWIAVALKGVLSDLEGAPASALGLGLAGAIPFVLLTPPLAYLVPLPDLLKSNPIEAQAAYGAVILSFLGGAYWGLAMAAYATPPKLHSAFTSYTLRYIWGVVPSLLAWPALLLPLATRLSALLASFGFVLAVDIVFARMGLLPSWYLPLRILLTLIAMLSMGSSLLVTAASRIPETVLISGSDKSSQELSAQS